MGTETSSANRIESISYNASLVGLQASNARFKECSLVRMTGFLVVVSGVTMLAVPSTV